MNAQLYVNAKVAHNSPKVILFDKDGTLIDIHFYWSSMIRIRAEKIAQRYLLGSNAIDMQNKLIDVMGVDLKTDRMKSNGPVGVKPRSYIVNITADVIRSSGYSITNDEMESLFKEVDEMTGCNMKPLLKLLPGVSVLLEQLQQYGILAAIVSTDITQRACQAMQALELEHYFSEIIGGDLVDNTKPAPDLVELTLSRIGISCADAVVVGDHPVDIEMGVSASVPVNIGVLTGLSNSYAFDQYQCCVVPDLTALKIV